MQTQIDIPPLTNPVVTRYHVGWCYCSVCKKQVLLNDMLSHSKYGPNLHAAICYWKFKMGLTLGKIHQMLLDNYKLDISTGQISEMLSRSGKEFNGVVDKGCVRLNNDFQNFVFHPPDNDDLKRLSKRLIKYRGEMFTFIRTGVEPTNNNAAPRFYEFVQTSGTASMSR